jgi:hypothetical protein
MGVMASLTGQVSIMVLMGIRNDFFCQLWKLIVTAVAAHADFGGNLFLGRVLLVTLIAGDTEALVFVGQEALWFNSSQ